MSAHDKTGVGGGRDRWQTPPGLFRQIQRRYQFTYDAFASHENALLPTYSTIEGTFRSAPCGIEQIDTLDGLHQEWTGRRVFLNPPYANGMLEKAAAKCVGWAQEAEIIVGLFPVDTSTKWWHLYIAEFADMEFLPKRVRYVHPMAPCSEKCKHALGEPADSPPGGSMIVVWRRRYEL